MSGVRQTWAVATRELGLLLSTPMFWVLSGVFFLASSFVFLSLLLGYSDPVAREQNNLSSDVTIAVIHDLFYVINFFLIIQIPLLTMRTLAEERRHNTLNLLQTTPVREWSVVLGKFIANAGAMILYLLVTLVFPLTSQIIGANQGIELATPDWPVVLSCYMALVLGVFAYSALGIFYSSLTDSQVIAAVLTYVTLFLLLIFSGVSDMLGYESLIVLSHHLTLQSHIDGFLTGYVATIDIVWFLLFSFLFLFFAVRQLESLRWRS